MKKHQMKKETLKFIFDLFVRELEAEFIQNNENIEEVDYVQMLIEASRDFATSTGEFAYVMIIEDYIEQLVTDKPMSY